MLALYRAGRQAEALQTYAEGRRLLVDQLGIEPSRDLQQLHGAILRQESGLEAPGAAPPAEDHFEQVLDALFQGRLVAVLGTEIGDLTARLAPRFAYAENRHGLPRLAPFVPALDGPGPP